MFKLYSILALLKKGTSLTTAWKAVEHIKLSRIEYQFLGIVSWAALLYFLTVYLVTHADEYKERFRTRDAVANLYHSKTAKYEQVIISCLNGHGVVINGRNMKCVIRDYKEAI